MNKIILLLLLTNNLIICLTMPVLAQGVKPATKPDCRETLHKITVDDGKVIKDEKQVYNSDGLLIERKVLICFSGKNDCEYYVSVSEYDSAKNLIKSISKDPRGKIESEFSCTYNANNQPVKRVNNSILSNDWFEQNYYYNNSNQKIRYVALHGTTAEDIKRREEILYEYHANGKVKKETTLNIEEPEGPGHTIIDIIMRMVRKKVLILGE